LNRFQDFVLFKGTLTNIISGGRFDNNWKLPITEAEKMKNTGVVTVK
jgi:hypothetical protein